MLMAALGWGWSLPERAFLADDYIYLYYAENTAHWYAGHFSHWGPRNHLRPVTWFTVYLEDQIFGLQAPAHHAVHLLMHLCNGLFFFLILSRLFPGRRWTAALASGLFLLHPIHADPLGWASGAVDVVAGFWLLSCLAAYLFARTAASAKAKLIFPAALLLALYAKETGFMLMLLIPLVDLFRPSDAGQTKVIASGRWWLLTWLLGGIYLLSRLLALGSLTGTAGAPAELGPRLWSPDRMFGAVIPQMLHYLAVPVPDSLAPPLHPLLIGLCLLFGLWLAWGWVREKTWALALFGGLWMLIAVIPAVPVFQIGPNLEQGRYLYLPALGFCLLIAAAGSASTFRPWKRLLVRLPLVLLLGAEFLGLRHNLKPWRESWEIVHNLTRQVREFRPHWNEGDELILYDLPRLHRGTYLLGDDQTLTVAMNWVLFSPEAMKATRRQAQGLRVPLEARACGFISPAAEIPPPAWDWPRLGQNWFVYQYQEGKLLDLTSSLRARLQERQRLLNSLAALPSLELYSLNQSEVVSAHDLSHFPDGGFRPSGPLPYLLFPQLNISALLMDKLDLELRVTGTPRETWATLYWSDQPAPRFTQEQRASFRLILDGRPHRYLLDLGGRPRWLRENSVQWFRLDPGTAQLWLLNVKILPFSKPETAPP